MAFKRNPPHEIPWAPYDFSRDDVAAIKSVRAGVANPDQQRHAIDLIVNGLAGTYDLSFRPDTEHATAFAEGGRFVGLQIVRAMNMDITDRFDKDGAPTEQGEDPKEGGSDADGV
jgi:hypothetical protein